MQRLGLRWSVSLPEPRPDTDVTPEQLVEAAKAVEDAGFDAVWVSDHPLPYDLAVLARSGHEISTRYDMGAGHQTWDPFTVLGWLAGATRELRLHVSALVLPYRNPFITAKAAATLQHLSGGRLIMGLAPGYMKAEFDALGVDIADRSQLVDEGVAALRAAWSGEPFELASARWQVAGNSALPAPKPQPPLWAAGNSLASIRRAARICDGWAPFEVTAQGAAVTGTVEISTGPALTKRIDRCRELRAEAGRTGPFDICLIRPDWAAIVDRPREQVRDELAGLHDAGVTWLGQNLLVCERGEWLRRLDALYEVVS